MLNAKLPDNDTAVVIAVGFGSFSIIIWFKTSKIRANSFVIWAHQWRKTVSISVKTFFFFFFLENTLIWTEKPSQFQ